MHKIKHKIIHLLVFVLMLLFLMPTIVSEANAANICSMKQYMIVNKYAQNETPIFTQTISNQSITPTGIYKSGINAHLLKITSNNSWQTWSTPQSGDSISLASGELYKRCVFDINYISFPWTEPGVYRYKITTTANNSEIQIPNRESYLDIAVGYGNDGNDNYLSIVGTVLHNGLDTNSKVTGISSILKKEIDFSDLTIQSFKDGTVNTVYNITLVNPLNLPIDCTITNLVQTQIVTIQPNTAKILEYNLQNEEIVTINMPSSFVYSIEEQENIYTTIWLHNDVNGVTQGFDKLIPNKTIGFSDDSVSFINSEENCLENCLKIVNNTKGNLADINKDFHYMIKLTNPLDAPLATITFTDRYGELEEINVLDGTEKTLWVSLSDGEYVTIDKLKHGMSYSISKIDGSDEEGYIMMWEDGTDMDIGDIPLTVLSYDKTINIDNTKSYDSPQTDVKTNTIPYILITIIPIFSGLLWFKKKSELLGN